MATSHATAAATKHTLVRASALPAAAGPLHSSVWQVKVQSSFVLTNLITPWPVVEDPSCYRPRAEQHEAVVLYLHGFPAQSCDHRRQTQFYGSVSERFAKKVQEFVTAGIAPATAASGAVNSNKSGSSAREEISSSTSPGSAPHQVRSFCACNFRGTPGSGDSFRSKTVRKEVEDVVAVIQFLTETLPHFSGVHVVGISTGAIIASLLRGPLGEAVREKILTLTAIAGCGCSGMDTALRYDFDEAQLLSFEENGYCLKDYWLPLRDESNPGEAVLVAEEMQVVEQTTEQADEKSRQAAQNALDNPKYYKHQLKLDKSYMDDFLSLDVKASVSSPAGSSCAVVAQGVDTALFPGRDDDAEKDPEQHFTPAATPLLIIHGKEDRAVPFSEGELLFQTACEPKRFCGINKGNHLLTNSKDMKKALNEIADFIKTYNSRSMHSKPLFSNIRNVIGTDEAAKAKGA
ncbi:unnamed protein product [Amoebophrya sp. A120]|nr:unnamed protein product [Amoebophrya sp. A120]|eukprot:GSA120T00020824001.1